MVRRMQCFEIVMKAVSTALLVACCMVARADTARPLHPELPWITGLDRIQLASAADPDAASGMTLTEELEPGCTSAARHATFLRADVARSPGRETIVASYAGGIAVLSAEGRLLTSVPGYPCSGSADAIESIFVGTAWGTSTIGVVVTTGGHTEADTWVSLYRIAIDGRLEATFSGTVELYRDGDTEQGMIVFLPGALVHQEPTGETVLWTWNDGGFYVPATVPFHDS